jgi:hypothetical protein
LPRLSLWGKGDIVYGELMLANLDLNQTLRSLPDRSNRRMAAD